MLSRFPSRESRTVAFEIEAEGKRAVMSISWLTLEHEFECTIETDSDADAVFDGNAGKLDALLRLRSMTAAGSSRRSTLRTSPRATL